MRYIQYTLDEEEFLRLRSVCVIQKTNLKSITRKAILLYLNQFLENFNGEKGEQNHGQKTIKSD